MICFWFYVCVSLVFSVCFHFWNCLLVWLLSSFFSLFFSFFILWVCVYVSLCDFCLFSFAFTICFGVSSVRFLGIFFSFVFVLYCFYFLFFLCTVWLAGYWCSGWGSGQSLRGGRAKSRTLDHQRTPGPMEYLLVRSLSEVSISTLRPRSTQRPASCSADHLTPNN